jgi:hypothetical protein
MRGWGVYVQSGFVFHPVQLHLEPTDLAVEFVEQFTLPRLVLVTLPREHLRQHRQRLALPRRHLVRMHLVLAGPFRQRPITLDRRQRHFRLELRGKYPPHSCHAFAPEQSLDSGGKSTLIARPVFWEYYSE